MIDLNKTKFSSFSLGYHSDFRFLSAFVFLISAVVPAIMLSFGAGAARSADVCGLGVCIDPKPRGGYNWNWSSRDTDDYVDRSQQRQDREDERLRQERNARYDDVRTRVQAALGQREYREALRLLLEQQMLIDGPNVRDMIVRVEALIMWADGNAAVQNKDYATAISHFRQALARMPDMFSQENRTYVTNLEDYLKNEQAALEQRQAAESAAREYVEREKRNRPQVEQLRAEAKAIMELYPAEAMAKLAAALELLPGDTKASGDWWLANAALARLEARYDDAIKALQSAQNFHGDLPVIADARIRVTNERIHQGTNVQIAFNDLRQRLTVAPNIDTSVVDARVPLVGTNLIVQVPELNNSPAADRISKGFQAVIAHDWPVALTWWQDALNRDPNNAALKRSVDLAQWMVDKRKATASGPVTPLGAAIYSASHGDKAGAIRQFELVKAENPAIAPHVDTMINELRQQQTQDAASAALMRAEFKNSNQIIVDKIFETGMNRLSIGDEKGAQAAFNDAEDFGKYYSVQPSQLPGPQPDKPSESSNLDFIRN